MLFTVSVKNWHSFSGRSMLQICPECVIKEMMLITWSASWWEWSRPTQRKRSGDFCTTTAWSNKRREVKTGPLNDDWRRKKRLWKKKKKDCLHPNSTVTEYCERKERAQKDVECYFWYIKPTFCDSCMKTLSVCGKNKRRMLFFSCSLWTNGGINLGKLWIEKLHLVDF